MTFKRTWLVLGVAAIGACGQPATAEQFGNPATTTSRISNDVPARKLAQEVTRVFTVLTPSPSTQMAMAVLEVRAVDDIMANCMAAAGQPYARRTRQFSRAWRESSGTLAAWWAPPFSGNPSNGLGIAGPNAKSDSNVDPIVVEDLGLTPADQVTYDSAEADCAGDLPNVTVVDWTPINELEGQMATIARDAKLLPGFAPIAKSYRDCVLSRGLDFVDPDGLLEAVKDKYNSGVDPKDAAKFERSAAVADAHCRVSIWPEFLQLAEPQWQAFLDRNTEAVELISETWRRIEREAGPIEGAED